MIYEGQTQIFLFLNHLNLNFSSKAIVSPGQAGLFISSKAIIPPLGTLWQKIF